MPAKKSSEETVPPKGKARWVWASMAPLTGSVHDLVRLDVREVGADGGDLLILDGNVSLEHFLLGYDGSVFDDQIHK